MNVYIFNGSNSVFPSGVFLTKELAFEWIKKHKLSGVLNVYPSDTGLYDWSIKNNFFTVKNENQKTSKFIQQFTSASIEHYHFENGILD